MKTPSDVKDRASKLRDVLSVMGHQLKHSESLEVISKMEGYPDWNTHVADIKKQEQVNQYLKNTHFEAANSSSDHPIIDAIKSDNEVLLRKSLHSEVLSNNEIMSEAFYQSVVLERMFLAGVMIEQGADVASINIRGQSLFDFAIHTEREDYIKMLILKFKHLKKIHPKSSGVLPRVVAHVDKSEDAIKYATILLDQGANIDAKIQEGETAIILAGWVKNDLKLVSFLIDRGADVNLENDNGDTPLIDAAFKGNNDILTCLLNNGADISIKNHAGHTALDVARHQENAETISILVKHKELQGTL